MEIWFGGAGAEVRYIQCIGAIFVDVGCKKLRKALIEAENEQAEKNAEKK